MFNLNNKIKNRNFNPILIAEISCNHNGSIELAKELILQAKLNGADAVKLQAYGPENMTLNSEKDHFKIKEGLWKGYTFWDLYEKAKTPLNWQRELFEFAKDKDIFCFSTPFDENSLTELEKINCQIYKVSSFELTDLYFIEKIAKTKKPIILSTGLANLDEVEEAIVVAKNNGAEELAVMYCVSNYPSKVEDFNLNFITEFQKKYSVPVGLSDHSNDFLVASGAVILGAKIFEKHLVLDSEQNSLDQEFSLTPERFKDYRNIINQSYSLIKNKQLIRSKDELENLKFRRSIFCCKDIKKGEFFDSSNVKCIRPFSKIALLPKFYSLLLGKKSKRNISFGDPITIKDLEK